MIFATCDSSSACSQYPRPDATPIPIRVDAPGYPGTAGSAADGHVEDYKVGDWGCNVHYQKAE
jgi:hypothetical protein